MNLMGNMKKKILKHLIEAGTLKEESPLFEKFSAINREEFVLPNLKNLSYDDCSLPLGEGQVMHSPYLTAFILSSVKVKNHETVLEIGTGSGYETYLFSELAKDVDSFEVSEKLYRDSNMRLSRKKVKNVRVILGDGLIKLDSKKLYDVIWASGRVKEIPQVWLNNLREGGRLVVSVGEKANDQLLMKYTKRNGHLLEEMLCPVNFYPLEKNSFYSRKVYRTG